MLKRVVGDYDLAISRCDAVLDRRPPENEMNTAEFNQFREHLVEMEHFTRTHGPPHPLFPPRGEYSPVRDHIGRPPPPAAWSLEAQRSMENPSRLHQRLYPYPGTHLFAERAYPKREPFYWNEIR